MIQQAKGYPDIASRQFLRRVADHSPSIPMFILVDHDPDGIAIMSTYKHGSYRLAHKGTGTHGSYNLTLPQLKWIGVHSHQIHGRPSSGSTKSSDSSDHIPGRGHLKLTSRDRDKARHMLEWDLCAEDGLETTWRRELQNMLMLNIKAEMQVLDELRGGLPSWLSAEIRAYTAMELVDM